MAGYGNYDKSPSKKIAGYTAECGWQNICDALKNAAQSIGARVITVECYTQIDRAELSRGLSALGAKLFDAESCVPDEKYRSIVRPYVTDDRVFGIMNTLKLEDVYDPEKVDAMRGSVASESGLTVVYGVGASLVTEGDILVYADLARWEIQRRFARGAENWKADNASAPKLAKFKQGFFVEWRMADRRKKKLFDKIDYYLDTNTANEPKLITGDALRAGLNVFARQPFRLVPYFAPEVWGGQWMKEVCGLDDSCENYAWAFDGVPEENSIYMDFDGVKVEVPSVNAVFYRPKQLLGERVHARFGDEFPIRFDFLDTMQGQNLSLQVHPLTEYIQNTFGMHYTQDESYYILDCDKDAVVYLGLKKGVDREQMLADLEKANRGEIVFDADKYVNKLPARKHDHFLIPAGTVHCSGKNTMVLEISATPYIFTFKLWDWARLGLDGKPRPVHIGHGREVVQWDRDIDYVKQNLVNRLETLQKDDGVFVERTGLHEREFIDTTRYVISGSCRVQTNDSVQVMNVTDGEGAIVTSPDGEFEPYEVHYAETFIVPAAAKQFELRPIGKSVTIVKAQVRN